MDDTNPTNPQEAARAIHLALDALLTLLTAKDADRCLWPPPEVHDARVALRKALPFFKAPWPVEHLVHERAADQEQILAAQNRTMMVRDVNYWRACMQAWLHWTVHAPTSLAQVSR